MNRIETLRNGIISSNSAGTTTALKAIRFYNNGGDVVISPNEKASEEFFIKFKVGSDIWSSYLNTIDIVKIKIPTTISSYEYSETLQVSRSSGSYSLGCSLKKGSSSAGVTIANPISTNEHLYKKRMSSYYGNLDGVEKYVGVVSTNTSFLENATMESITLLSDKDERLYKEIYEFGIASKVYKPIIDNTINKIGFLEVNTGNFYEVPNGIPIYN